MRPLIVGLAPGSRDGVGKTPFQPGGSSRRRLQELTMEEDLEAHFRTVNLVPRYIGEGSKILTQDELMRCAGEVLRQHQREGGVIVALGRTVQRALFPGSFGRTKHVVPLVDYELSYQQTRHGYGAWVLPLPHPSGLCREWNDPENIVRAQSALRDLIMQEHDC